MTLGIDPGRRVSADAKGRRVTGVDAGRAFAALAVLVCHVQGYWLGPDNKLPWPFPQIINNGAHGVDLFVVISGFCLAMPFAGAEGVRVGNFWRRRALRLLPAYYLAVLVALIMLRPAGATSFSNLAIHASMLQSIVPGHLGTINGSLWIVALEVQLYLLFPFTLYALRRLGGSRLLALTAVLSIAWGLLGYLHVGTLGDPTLWPARLVQFVSGMALAGLIQAGGRPSRAVAWKLFLLGSFAGLTVSTLNLGPLDAVVWAVPSIGLITLLLGSDRRGLAPAESFGKYTYSFYLLHQPVLLVLAPFGLRLTTEPAALMVVGCIYGWTATMLLSALLYRLVELPTQNYGRRWGVVRRRPVVARAADVVIVRA